MAKTPAEREETKLIMDLRKQVVKLKRENSQLKKRNTRIENDYAELSEDEVEEVAPPVLNPYPKARCAKCNSKHVNIIELVGKNYYKCQDCEAQGLYKK